MPAVCGCCAIAAGYAADKTLLLSAFPLICHCTGWPQHAASPEPDERCFEAGRCADCHLGGAHCIAEAGDGY